jgi:ribose transport system ATP-binding protein
LSTLVSLRGITKTYPGVVALRNVSLDIEAGEIHALVGENGAGKSTLIKVITGAIAPDAGTIGIADISYPQMTPTISRSLGIEAIYQEFNLAGSLSVAENIFMGQNVSGGPLVSFRQLNQKAAEILSAFHVDIGPADLVRTLSVAKMQLVEIAKAVARNAKLLIMDEPTAPLTDNEVEILFGLVRRLSAEGVTIIYISHRLEEVFQLTDRVTVMRDGEVIVTKATKDLSKDDLIMHMVGRELSQTVPARQMNYGPVVLEAENLSGNGVQGASLQLRSGEILGLAGLVGAGRTELARLIFGADRMDSGRLLLDGEPVNINSPGDAVRHGIGLLTEDRKEQGVLLQASVRWNTSITILKSLSRVLVISKRRETEKVTELKDALNIKTPTIDQKVVNLSGGNQQKVALAKWIASQCRVLIFDEPTRGIDVGAKQEIYQLINELAAQGLGILIISSEMEEILGLSDRLIVLHEGRIAGRLERADYTQAAVLRLASGEQLIEESA